MSKLMDKMKAGRAALMESQGDKKPEQPVAQPDRRPPLLRAPSSPHGSVLAMKNEMLQHEVNTLKAGTPVIKIDPKKIVPSKWANRHDDSYESSEFVQFKAEIESAGGNVQPIKVRPLPQGHEYEYEVVFGRHRACFELGLEVSAVVESIDDKSLFIEMDRENRQRADLRPYETGVMYAKALKEGLFPSAKKLAEAASIDPTYLGRALALAGLNTDVINAFSSPLDLQFRWASELTEALKKDPDRVLAEAKAIQGESPRPASKHVLRRLVDGGSTVLPPSLKKIPLTGVNGQTAAVKLNAQTKTVDIKLKNINPDRFAELQKAIKSLIS